MRSHIFRQIFSGILCAGLAVTVCQMRLFAQQPPAAPTEEILTPEELTRILKEEWQFLKEETDAFLANTNQRGEFETKAEFDERVARQKQIYLSKVNSHIAERKFDKRKFAVLFKAVLVSYQTDLQRYSISAGSIVEAPYNAPTIKCSVAPNAYLGLSDSIRSGYRKSQLYLKFRPNFKWKTGRENAQQAKNEEGNVYFKVNFVLDLTQVEMKKQANLKIVPKEISLINQNNQQKFWDGGAIRIGAEFEQPVKKSAPKKAKAPADSTVTK